MPEHAAPATQTRYPWRTTVRSGFQFVVGLAPMVPVIVDASGIPEGTAGVAGAIAISAGVTRVMALPAVDAFLQRFIPWLAAAKPVGDGVAYRGPVDQPVPPVA